jgi:uncharacterized protein YjgD (DUF1641 family)
MTDDNKPKIRFMPGAFDAFEGTQEELDELIAEINQLAESGEIHKRAQPVDMDEIAESDQELFEILQSQIEQINDEENEERYRNKLN